jgi:superoxide dismutase
MPMTRDEVYEAVEEAIVESFGSMEEFVFALAEAGVVELEVDNG